MELHPRTFSPSPMATPVYSRLFRGDGVASTPSTDSGLRPPLQPGQLDLALLLKDAGQARSESLRAERDWDAIIEARVKQCCPTPAAAKATRECAELLAERAFAPARLLRSALQRLERTALKFGDLHGQDLSALAAALQIEHAADRSCLEDELQALEAQVQALRAERDQQSDTICALKVAYTDAQRARQVDAQRLRDLIPTGYELAQTDDAAFNAQLAARADARHAAHMRAMACELEAVLPGHNVGAPQPGANGRGVAAADAQRKVERAQAQARAAHAALAEHMSSTPRAVRVWRRQDDTLHVTKGLASAQQTSEGGTLAGARGRHERQPADLSRPRGTPMPVSVRSCSGAAVHTAQNLPPTGHARALH